MWPDGLVLAPFVSHQRRDAWLAGVAATVAGLALVFATFTLFAGLSAESLGTLRAGLVLGFIAFVVGTSCGVVSVAGWRRRRGRLRVGAAVLAGAIFSVADLAARIGTSEKRATKLFERGRREGWLSIISAEPVYPSGQAGLESNAIKRDQAGWTTNGQPGSRQ